MLASGTAGRAGTEPSGSKACGDSVRPSATAAQVAEAGSHGRAALRGTGQNLAASAGRARQNRYQARFLEALGRFRGGRLLAADENPAVEEGSWEHQKVVLLAFPGTASFREWADSPDYRKIAADRLAATHGVVLLVDGTDDLDGAAH
jgi:uncharacterized protein (DUF1330 family)